MVRAKRVTTREARFIKIHIFRENKEYFPSLSQLAAKKLRNRAVESTKLYRQTGNMKMASEVSKTDR